MKLLDRFEQSMERLLEGTVGTVFRQKMQPAELGKLLQKAMIDQKRVSVGTTIVPNRYIVHLNPRDFAQFSDYQEGLSRQMEKWLFEVATERRFSVLDRISVTLEEDERVPKRRPAIDATITDMHRSHPPSQQRGGQGSSRSHFAPPPPAQATQMFRPAHARGSGTFSLRATSGVVAGQEFQLRDGESTIGRSAENSIVLVSSDVSRHHARIEFGTGQVRVYDLGSTNGTRVNGDAVRVSDVFGGDRISFGSQEFEVLEQTTHHATKR